jgi:NarL family two-component system sensor histidine kinase LiaS
LSLRNGCVQLEVQDDGVGFELAARRDSGHGLRNIAARARELGASSEVVSAPGKGTRVLVSVPLEQAA